MIGVCIDFLCWLITLRFILQPKFHLAAALYTVVFRDIHCTLLGCATITPNHPGFRIYLDSCCPSFLAQKFVFHSYSIKMDKAQDKELIEDPRFRTQAAGYPYNSPYKNDSHVRPQIPLSTSVNEREREKRGVGGGGE